MRIKKRKYKIKIKINLPIGCLEQIEQIMDRRIMPLKKKYPHADIYIEVLC